MYTAKSHFGSSRWCRNHCGRCALLTGGVLLQFASIFFFQMVKNVTIHYFVALICVFLVLSECAAYNMQKHELIGHMWVGWVDVSLCVIVFTRNGS